MKKFEFGKKYVFSMEEVCSFLGGFMGEYYARSFIDRISWIKDADQKEVTVLDERSGFVWLNGEEYDVEPEWCVEVL